MVRICRSWEYEIESGQYKICEFLIVLQELRESRNFLTETSPSPVQREKKKKEGKPQTNVKKSVNT